MLKVTFLTDEYDEYQDRIYDAVQQIGGYDVEIEEVERDPTPPRRTKPKNAR